MKTKYLLPHCYKMFGWVLSLAGLSIIIWGLFLGEALPLDWHISIPWPFTEKISMFGLEVINGRIYSNFADELLCLTIIAGLFLVAFSRQKIEDERISQIRLEALQWGIYINYFILIICIFFI